MSNFLAVAAVTASLSHLLQSVVGTDVPGATVTTVRPDASVSAAHPPVVHLFLYQVLANAAARNADLPTRRADGNLVDKPVAALDLHYLLTFYGDDAHLEPQRLLGSTLRTLHTRPVLGRDVIQAAISDPTFAASVGQSDLGDQVERVRITPMHLSLEELSKVWSVFFQTPYALSAAYHASPILIESDEQPNPPGLPVRTPNVVVAPFRQPRIDSVASAAGALQPILAGGTVVISGQRLRADLAQVRIGTQVLTPPAASISDSSISLALPAGLQAGVQTAQVLQPVQLGSPPVPHAGVESNVAAFVLRPTITAHVDNVTTDASGLRSANVTLGFDPPVAQNQRVILFLNQLQGPGAFSFLAPPRSVPESASLVFTVGGVPAGGYLVRVQVDGAESVPVTDAAGQLATPGITL